MIYDGIIRLVPNYMKTKIKKTKIIEKAENNFIDCLDNLEIYEK